MNVRKGIYCDEEVQGACGQELQGAHNADDKHGVVSSF